MAGRGFVARVFVAATVLVAAVATASSAAVRAEPRVADVAGIAERDALAAATDSGVPEQVAGSQTETSRVWATPAGKLVLEAYAVPHWMPTGTGGWRQIDKRLRLDNGVVAPVATLAGTRFSAGGAAALVTLPVGGGSVSFSWPSALPAPRLDGDTAVYPSVFDGVDLRVTALEDGFSWSLVVQSRVAAQNPALDRLRLRVATDGLTATTEQAGGFAVRDGAGRKVLGASDAVMWDAAGTTSKARRALTSGSDPARIFRQAPDAAHRAELSTRIDGDDLVIAPDPAVLRGPKTVYPVVIDPWTTKYKIRWGYTNESNANKDDGVARVGDDPDGTGIERSFFAFNLASLAGTQILSAQFQTTMTHSYSCTSSPVSLWRTGDMTTAGKQVWNGPDPAKWLQKLSGHAHKPSGGEGCGDDPQPDLPMEFAAASLRDDIDLNKGQTNYTLGLLAGDSARAGEGSVTNWKKFDPAATKLSVQYNTPPKTPVAGDMKVTADYTAPTADCVTGANRPLVRSTKPWLKAFVNDPDGSGGGLLRADFTLQRLNGSAWSAVALDPRFKDKVAPGKKAELQVTKNVSDGDVLRWQVKVSDTLGGESGLSGWCEFQLDTSGPTAMPSVESADGLYPEETPDAAVHGNMGRSGRFTFGPNGQTDVASYTYQINGGPVMTATPAAAGGSVTVWVTPTQPSDNILSVSSKDVAGNPSPNKRDYSFKVDEGNAPVARWDLDEGTGNTSSGTGAALQLANAPVWTEDRLVGAPSGGTQPKAVQFNGVNQSADSAAGVVDTSKSFSVSAWVKLNKLDGTYQTIVSQEGSYFSAFYLQAMPAVYGKWRFVRVTSDAAGAGSVSAMSVSAPVVGVWTHLAGVYDAGTQQISLYVNGVLQTSTTYSPANAWNATGPTHLARARTAGSPSDFAGATIGEARIWDRVVDARIDLGPLVDPVLVADWEMGDADDEAPRLVSDDSDYGRPLVLSEPASTVQWTSNGYNLSTGLLTNGVAGYAATSGHVVRTDQSFSVAAWVRRDSNTGYQAVWGQDGVVNSSAYLRYQDNYPGGAWVFGMRSKDDSTGTQIAAYTVGTVGAWTHLVATYDAQTAQMSLYVNGVLADQNIYRPTWDSTGPFSVGRMKYLSGNINFWNGAIDRVRVWQGALNQDTISNLFVEP